MFKSIPNFENYLINEYGVIINKKNKTIKPWVSKGYLKTTLRRNGKSFCRFVHGLVLRTFVEMRPKGKQCNHMDANKNNNFYKNLEWVTPHENHKHAHKMGLKNYQVGTADTFFSKQFRSKLKEGEVWLIRLLLSSKTVKQADIAKMFKVTQGCIWKIKSNYRWKEKGERGNKTMPVLQGK